MSDPVSQETVGMSFRDLIRRPSAFLPVAMSCAALALVLGHVAIYGITRQTDEGTAAHLFQLLLGSEVPIVAFFAIRWVPQSPLKGLLVLGIQIGGVIAALAPVYILEY